MSISICASCLSKLRIRSAHFSAPVATTQLASFHTTVPREKNAAVKHKSMNSQKGATGPKHRQSTAAVIKRKHRERPKPPAIGERKAQMKRIVLSNTNALNVRLQELSPENMASAKSVGQVLALPGDLLDQLRDAKAFKLRQNWSLFRRPATLVREETVSLGQDIEEIKDSQQDQGLRAKVFRNLITGHKGSGKSLLLLQAMSMAYLNGWIVINVPEGKDFTINHSSYAPVNTTDSSQEKMYIQPQLTSELLSRLAYSNQDVLSKLKLANSIPSNITLRKNNTLFDLVVYGAENQAHAHTVWQAVWKELNATGTHTPRPPLLIALDDINHWMTLSKYRSAEFEHIHAHQFVLIKQFLDLLFSKDQQSLPNGGMVLGATTGSNVQSIPTFDVLLRQLNARADGLETSDPSFPRPEPYPGPDPRILELFQNSEETGLVDLPNLSKAEATGLLNYFAMSGLLKQTVSDVYVGQLMGLSGGGNVDQLAKLGKRITVEPGI